METQTSRRSTERFSSAGSTETSNMLVKDKEFCAHSLCRDAYPANHCCFSSELFLGGGCGNVADVPGSHHPHADTLGFGNISNGIYDEKFYYGNGVNLPDFQRPYAPRATGLSSQPCDELYADVSRHFLAVDPSNFQYPIPENVRIAPQVQGFQTNLPVNFGRHVDEGRFCVTDNMTCLGSSGLRNKIFGESGGMVFMPNGLEEFGAFSPQSTRSKPFSRENSFLRPAYTGAYTKRTGPSELFANDFEMCSSLGSSCNGSDSTSSFRCRGYFRGQCSRGSFCACASGSSAGNDCNWPIPDESKQRVSYNGFLCGCNATLDMLTEINRGPSACRLRVRRNMITPDPVDRFCQNDSLTGYRDAKFFVIKSYSEDNVHKSIKYSVWASTANGNKKLDAAYREAMEKGGTCPVFLLFSVNASSQFCGVAEMTGPVDFDMSVEYWQQDKWTGHFPVKWLIIKDVPNSMFRHIILENNDNKPVTNSRDTQEVGLEHGLEMLSIFMNCETHSSILDDFYFYDERQKAMQERKARQRAVQETSSTSAAAIPAQPSSSVPGDLVKKLSKSFVEALALDQNIK